jgi:hypothetical protein
MKRTLLDRRTFIKAGSVALAVPWLEAMFSNKAMANGSSDPKRYVCLYIASGTYMKANDGAFWYPGTTPGPLDPNNLPIVFAPFASNVGDFSIIRGLDNRARYQCQGTGGDHSTAIASYLTSTPYTNGDLNSCTINGSSFDNAYAQAKGLTAYAMSASGYDGFHADNTPFDYSRTVSYLNGQQSDCWLNPYALWQSLFASLPTSDAGTGAPPPPVSVFVKNKSILDSAVAGINKLKAMLGTADQQRVDDYYTSLRDFENTLSTPDGGVIIPSACNGNNPPPVTLNNEDHIGTGLDFGSRLQAFMDIISLAFKCNSAQAFSFLFEYENTNRQFQGQIPSNLVYMGADMTTPGSHNEIAHWADGGTGEETERSNRCVSRDRYYASWLMYLVNSLKSATDPSGSRILDNTIIQFGNGLHDGNHNTDGQQTTTGLPTVVAGGKNMLSPGNFYFFPNNDLSDLYYTFNQKLGAGLSSFGGSTTVIAI